MPETFVPAFSFFKTVMDFLSMKHVIRMKFPLFLGTILEVAYG